MTFSLSGSNYFSYAVAGSAGRWRFVDSVNTALVLGFARAESATTWGIFDPHHRQIADARGPDGVVAGLAWVSRRLVGGC
jgi:hypothetical protein